MKKQMMTLFLISTFLLSACSNANDEVTQTQPNQDLPSNAEQNQQDPQISDVKEEEVPSVVEKEPEVQEEPTIELTYHMNKNYDIVPNNDETPKKVVLLTFDDGPKDEKMINSLIDTLDKHNAKAIFFVNGYRVKENPDLLKLIHDRKQLIGNHSWDHIALNKEPEAEVKRQIEDVQNAVKDITGEAPSFFRPPFGAGGDVGKKVASDNGLLYMTWSNGSLDWEMKSTDKNHTATIIKNITDQLHAGSNILMHELPWTVEALESLLTELESRGYSYVDPRSIELQMR
ncbi:polysaccharide deacetylase family protein [Paenibacillus sp. CMAA1364]